MGQKKNRLNDGNEAKQSRSYTHIKLDSPTSQMYSSHLALLCCPKPIEISRV
jgi:hypothetical protein